MEGHHRRNRHTGQRQHQSPVPSSPSLPELNERSSCYQCYTRLAPTSSDGARHREHFRAQYPSLRPPRPSLYSGVPAEFAAPARAREAVTASVSLDGTMPALGPGRKAMQVGETFAVVQALSTPAAAVCSRRLAGRPANSVSPHGIGVLRLFVRRYETEWAIIWIRRRAWSVTACFALTVIGYDVDGYLTREHTPSCAPG